VKVITVAAVEVIIVAVEVIFVPTVEIIIGSLLVAIIIFGTSRFFFSGFFVSSIDGLYSRPSCTFPSSFRSSITEKLSKTIESVMNNSYGLREAGLFQ
jgi:hypothetical protein